MPLHLKMENSHHFAPVGGLVLSTEFARGSEQWVPRQSMRKRNELCLARELPLDTSVWRRLASSSNSTWPVEGWGERKESAHLADETVGKSNGKESQIRASRALLKAANTSRIALFEEPKRRSNAWAGEKVMDRDAERVAGGIDAV